MITRNKLFLFAIIIYVLPILNNSLYAQQNKLQFNSEQQFKIVQFTDTHFYKGGKKSPEVLQNIKFVLETENPDLVILTGDVVTGKGKKWPTIESWEIITDIFIDNKTPYAVAFGKNGPE